MTIGKMFANCRIKVRKCIMIIIIMSLSIIPLI